MRWGKNKEQRCLSVKAYKNQGGRLELRKKGSNTDSITHITSLLSEGKEMGEKELEVTMKF